MSRVKRAKEEKTPSLKDRALGLIKSLVSSFIKLLIHIILGVVCIQQCRAAQANLLPYCISSSPYTEEEVSVDQIHMDYLSTTDKGVEKSIKATYPVKENLAILQNSVIPKTIRDWTTSAQANNLTYYFGSCMAAGATSYYSIHTKLYSTVNSLFPQWLIMYASFTLIPIIFQIAGIWSILVFFVSSITNWQMLLHLKTVYQAGKIQKSKWTPDTGIWTYPSSPVTILLLIVVICFSPLMAMAGVGMALVLIIGTFLTTFQLYYSKIDQIKKVFIDTDEENVDSGATPTKTQAGGGSEGEGKGEGKDDKDDKDDEDDKGDKDDKGGKDDDAAKAVKAKANAEASCVKNNKTNSKIKEKFTVVDQLKLTFKVYRHIIMIIMTIYMLIDIQTNMGGVWLMSGIFAVLAMAHFTKVYHKYILSACDNFTPKLIGYTNSNRVCDPADGNIGSQKQAERPGWVWPSIGSMLSPF